MVDSLMVAERSERMGRIRGRNTKPELMVRQLTHGMGFRYRLHYAKLPGKPDMVFPGKRKVIFIHGCFWHRHSDPLCKLARLPKSKLDFWLPKLEANRQRDTKNEHKLKALGWEVLAIWECEIEDGMAVYNKIREFLI